MRIAVLGSGGIGGYYGALLARSGHDVVFIARGAHLEAMQRRGLTVRTSEGESTIPVTASADTAGVGTVDLVLFSVKSYDTATAAQALTPLMARDTAVITFQNGLDNVEAIAAAAGPEAVLPGVVYVALQLIGPGVILRTGGEGKVVFGELSGILTERVQRIADAFRQSGIALEVTPDIRRVLWDKFLFITGIGGVTALARSGIGPLLASAAGRSLLHAACAENRRGRAGRRRTPSTGRCRCGPRPGRNAPCTMAIFDGTRSRRGPASRGRHAERRRRSSRNQARHPDAVHQTIVACLSVHQPSASTTQEPHARSAIRA